MITYCKSTGPWQRRPIFGRMNAAYLSEVDKARGKGGGGVEESLEEASGAAENVCHLPDSVHTLQFEQ